MTAFGEVEKQVFEAARTRLLQTGFTRQQNQRNQNNQDANSRAKDGAEAERLALKASQAAKELAKQQAQLDTSMAAMSEDKDKGGGKDSGKERTNKQKKAEQFFDKRRQSIEKKRWEKSHRSEWKGWEVARDDGAVTGLNLPECLSALLRDVFKSQEASAWGSSLASPH